MRPFSFTTRDEEIQELTKKFSKSLPCVYNDDLPVKTKKFKAKPIPRNLFSNYIYKKMHEDEFYRWVEAAGGCSDFNQRFRALQKKIRAEEMLKHASLPPSMAKREKSRPKFDVCPRSYRDLDTPDHITQSTKTRKIPNFKVTFSWDFQTKSCVQFLEMQFTIKSSLPPRIVWVRAAPSRFPWQSAITVAIRCVNLPTRTNY